MRFLFSCLPLLMLTICAAKPPAGSASSSSGGHASATVEANGPVVVGELMPTFGGWGLDSKRISSRELVGPTAKSPSSALVVSFFASWCKPCKKGLPTIDKVVKQGSEKGYDALLIAFGEGPAKIKPFLSDLGLDYTTLVDEMKAVSGRLGVTKDLPVTYVVDSKGVVRRIFVREGDDFEVLLTEAMAEAAGK